jgi:hypothetical protein
MQRKKTWILGAVVTVLFAAGAAIAAGFDSPDGEPPFGLEFPEGRSGQQFEGIATIVFRGMVETNAQRFESVVRLRKGGEFHVFYSDYDCSPDSCVICTGGTIDTTQVADIQLCIESLIQSEVIDDFVLDVVDVRLKDVTDFKAEPHPDPANPGILVVGADVVVTAR